MILGTHPQFIGKPAAGMTHQKARQNISNVIQFKDFKERDVLLAAIIWSGGEGEDHTSDTSLRQEICKSCDGKFQQNSERVEFNYQMLIDIAKNGGAPLEELLGKCFPNIKRSILERFGMKYSFVRGALKQLPAVAHFMGKDQSTQILKRFPSKIAMVAWCIWLEESFIKNTKKVKNGRPSDAA